MLPRAEGPDAHRLVNRPREAVEAVARRDERVLAEGHGARERNEFELVENNAVAFGERDRRRQLPAHGLAPMRRDRLLAVAERRARRVADAPLVIGPNEVARAVLREALKRAHEHEPDERAEGLGSVAVEDQRAVREVHVEQRVRPVVARFELHACELRLGVGRENLVDFARRNLVRLRVQSDEDFRGLVPAATEEGDLLLVRAAREGADAALHDLRALDALEREADAAYVVKEFNRVPVNRSDLVSRLHERDDGVGVCFAARVLQRVHRERVVKLGDDEELAVGRHKVAVDPAEIDDGSEVRIDDLLEQGAGEVVEPTAARDGEAVEGIIKRDKPAGANVAEVLHEPRRVDAHEPRAHHAVERAVPVDAAAVGAWACSVAHDAVAGAEVSVRDARRHRHGHHVHRVGRAEVGRRRGVDA